MSWKTITTHPLYEVSDAGEVRNSVTGKIKKSVLNNSYHKVTLCTNGTSSQWSVHRLVALHFIENPEAKPYVDHIDRDKTNNHVSNLRWVTCKENSHNTGYYHHNKRDREHHVVSINQTFIVQIKGRTAVYKRFKTLEEAVAFRDQWMTEHPR